MSLETASTEPQFFGKNSFVPFIGTVEDVNDPKRSNRVKVRIIGWHVDDKNQLPTEDLPWAKVCMPVTHAQQSGIGGKHGMLPGCWVIGFFMDGEGAQDPYVLNTFNFTSKVLEKNNREPVFAEGGTIQKEFAAFGKSIDDQFPNSSRATEEEPKAKVPSDKSDAGRDSVLDASTDGVCPTNKSQAEKLRTEEPKSVGEKGNAESQNYKIGLADGVCGGIAGAREEIQNIMDELFIPQVSRFAYGDAVWNKFSGDFVNLNGNLLKIAEFVCSLLKYSINIVKAFQEDTIQRPAKAKAISAIPDRDGVLREVADFASSVLSDNFNASIGEIIDKLCMIILGILQEINNTTEEDNRQQSDKVSGSDNRNNRDQKGNIGASTTTKINDAGSLCVSDELLFKLDAEIGKRISDLALDAATKSSTISSGLLGMSASITSVNTNSFKCDDDVNDMNDKMSKELKSMKELNFNPDMGVPFDIGGSFGDIGAMLGDSAQYVQLALSLKFILFPQVHNKAGIQILDEINQAFECVSSATRMFDTAAGKLGSLAGVDFNNGFSGGGSKSGKSSKRTKDIQKNIGFGGSPISNQVKRPGEEIILCEDAFTKKIKDKIKKKKLILEWSPVDFHQKGRKYDLKGEEKFGNKKSNNSRILVNDQDDPTENGIYVSSARKWKRAEDADQSKEYVKLKILKVKNKTKRRNRWWVYVNRTNPRLGKHEILFEPLYKKNKRSPKDIDDLVKDKEIEDIAEVIEEDTKQRKKGKGSDCILIGLPSDDEDEAGNFVEGIPNQVIIKEPGSGYFEDDDDDDPDFKKKKVNENIEEGTLVNADNPPDDDGNGGLKEPKKENKFPSVYIPKYKGTPIPVVDPESGEMVSVLINPLSLEGGSNSISIIQDNSDIGIRSDDENYDIVIGGIFVGNTGQSYTEDTTITIIDKDTGEENGKIKPVIVEGRIVDVEIINNGTRFKRIPKLIVRDSLGVGTKLYPFMSLIPRNPDSPSVKPIAESVNLSFCVAKNQVNLIRPGRR